MKDLIYQLMQNSGVSSVSCVTEHPESYKTNGYSNTYIATPKDISDISSVTNSVLLHLLHQSKSTVFHENLKKTKAGTPVTPETPHSQIKPDLTYIFDWYLQNINSNLPIETLEAIAFDRTQEYWIRNNMPPVIKYNAALILERKEKARNILIAAGVKPCTRIEG